MTSSPAFLTSMRGPRSPHSSARAGSLSSTTCQRLTPAKSSASSCASRTPIDEHDDAATGGDRAGVPFSVRLRGSFSDADPLRDRSDCEAQARVDALYRDLCAARGGAHRRAEARDSLSRGQARPARLEGRGGHPAGRLSHGEKRQLEIAMILAGAPKLLLLDE